MKLRNLVSTIRDSDEDYFGDFSDLDILRATLNEHPELKNSLDDYNLYFPEQKTYGEFLYESEDYRPNIFKQALIQGETMAYKAGGAMKPYFGTLLEKTGMMSSEHFDKMAQSSLDWANTKVQEQLRDDVDMQALYAWMADEPFNPSSMLDPSSGYWFGLGRGERGSAWNLDIFGRSLAQAAPSMAVAMAGTVAAIAAAPETAGASLGTIPTIISLAPMFLLESTSSYTDAMNMMVDEFGMTPSEATGYAALGATAYGLVSSVLEKTGARAMLGAMGVIEGKSMLRSQLKSLIKNNVDANFAMRTAVRSTAMLGNALEGAIREGGTEWTQAITGEIVQLALRKGFGPDEESAVNNLGKEIQDIVFAHETLSEAYGGATMGVALGGPGGFIMKPKEAEAELETLKKKTEGIVATRKLKEDKVKGDGKSVIGFLTSLAKNRPTLIKEDPGEDASREEKSIFKHRGEKSFELKALKFIQDIGHTKAKEALNSMDKKDRDRLLTMVGGFLKNQLGMDITKGIGKAKGLEAISQVIGAIARGEAQISSTELTNEAGEAIGTKFQLKGSQKAQKLFNNLVGARLSKLADDKGLEGAQRKKFMEDRLDKFRMDAGLDKLEQSKMDEIQETQREGDLLDSKIEKKQQDAYDDKKRSDRMEDYQIAKSVPLTLSEDSANEIKVHGKTVIKGKKKSFGPLGQRTVGNINVIVKQESIQGDDTNVNFVLEVVNQSDKENFNVENAMQGISVRAKTVKTSEKKKKTGSLLSSILADDTGTPPADDTVDSQAQAAQHTSGAATGSDQTWGGALRKLGRTVFDVLPFKLTKEENLEADKEVVKASQKIGKNVPNKKTAKGRVQALIRRNWFQIKNASTVFAVSTFEDWTGTGKFKGRSGRRVKGGTGWGVQMAQNNKKTVFVFDQSLGQREGWLKSEKGGEFVKVTESEVIKAMASSESSATIGTKGINQWGKAAISKVTEGAFGKGTQWEAAAETRVTPKGTAKILYDKLKTMTEEEGISYLTGLSNTQLNKVIKGLGDSIKEGDLIMQEKRTTQVAWNQKAKDKNIKKLAQLLQGELKQRADEKPTTVGEIKIRRKPGERADTPIFQAVVDGKVVKLTSEEQALMRKAITERKRDLADQVKKSVQDRLGIQVEEKIDAKDIEIKETSAEDKALNNKIDNLKKEIKKLRDDWQEKVGENFENITSPEAIAAEVEKTKKESELLEIELAILESAVKSGAKLKDAKKTANDIQMLKERIKANEEFIKAPLEGKRGQPGGGIDTNMLNKKQFIQKAFDIIMSVAKNIKVVGQMYVDQAKGTVYRRVSSLYAEGKMKMTPLLKSSIDIGNGIDDLIRQFFLGKKPLTFKGQNVIHSEDAFVNFVAQLENIKTQFDKRGETVYAENITVASDKLGYAGTLDLLTVDDEGKIRIYDMKTRRQGLTYIKSTKYGMSDMEKWGIQLSAYKAILQDTFSIVADEMYVIPIKVMYEAGDTTTSESKILDFIQIKDMSHEIEWTGVDNDVKQDIKSRADTDNTVNNPNSSVDKFNKQIKTNPKLVQDKREPTDTEKNIDKQKKKRGSNKRGTEYSLKSMVQEKLRDHPLFAKKMIEKLIKKMPFVKAFTRVKVTKEEALSGGKLKLGYFTENGKYYRNNFEVELVQGDIKHLGAALGNLVEWAKHGNLDTPPHEFFHVFFNLMTGTPIWNKAIKVLGREMLQQGFILQGEESATGAVSEALAKWVGKYYTQRMFGTSTKKLQIWLKTFWAKVKNMIAPGKLNSDDIAHLFADEFFNDTPFKGDVTRLMGDIPVQHQTEAWANVLQSFRMTKQSNIGQPLTIDMTGGICDGTCGRILSKLKDEGINGFALNIYAKSPGGDWIIGHVVAATIIDGETYIINMPQSEFMASDHTIDNVWEDIEYNIMESGHGINHRLVPEGTHYSRLPKPKGRKGDPALVDLGSSKTYVDHTYPNTPRTMTEWKWADGKGGLRYWHEQDVYEVKSKHAPIFYTETHFQPRVFKATLQNMMDNYQIPRKAAEKNMEMTKTQNKQYYSTGHSKQLPSPVIAKPGEQLAFTLYDSDTSTQAEEDRDDQFGEEVDEMVEDDLYTDNLDVGRSLSYKQYQTIVSSIHHGHPILKKEFVKIISKARELLNAHGKRRNNQGLLAITEFIKFIRNADFAQGVGRKRTLSIGSRKLNMREMNALLRIFQRANSSMRYENKTFWRLVDGNPEPAVGRNLATGKKPPSNVIQSFIDDMEVGGNTGYLNLADVMVYNEKKERYENKLTSLDASGMMMLDEKFGNLVDGEGNPAPRTIIGVKGGDKNALVVIDIDAAWMAIGMDLGAVKEYVKEEIEAGRMSDADFANWLDYVYAGKEGNHRLDRVPQAFSQLIAMHEWWKATTIDNYLTEFGVSDAMDRSRVMFGEGMVPRGLGNFTGMIVPTDGEIVVTREDGSEISRTPMTEDFLQVGDKTYRWDGWLPTSGTFLKKIENLIGRKVMTKFGHALQEVKPTIAHAKGGTNLAYFKAMMSEVPPNIKIVDKDGNLVARSIVVNGRGQWVDSKGRDIDFVGTENEGKRLLGEDYGRKGEILTFPEEAFRVIQHQKERDKNHAAFPFSIIDTLLADDLQEEEGNTEALNVIKEHLKDVARRHLGTYISMSRYPGIIKGLLQTVGMIKRRIGKDEEITKEEFILHHMDAGALFHHKWLNKFAPKIINYLVKERAYKGRVDDQSTYTMLTPDSKNEIGEKETQIGAENVTAVRGAASQVFDETELDTFNSMFNKGPNTGDYLRAIEMLNGKLNQVAVKVMAVRFPTPDVGSVGVFRIRKFILDKGDSASFNAKTVFGPMQGDFDGDHVAIHFLPSNVISALETVTNSKSFHARKRLVRPKIFRHKMGIYSEQGAGSLSSKTDIANHAAAISVAQFGQGIVTNMKSIRNVMRSKNFRIAFKDEDGKSYTIDIKKETDDTVMGYAPLENSVISQESVYNSLIEEGSSIVDAKHNEVSLKDIKNNMDTDYFLKTISTHEQSTLFQVLMDNVKELLAGQWGYDGYDFLWKTILQRSDGRELTETDILSFNYFLWSTKGRKNPKEHSFKYSPVRQAMDRWRQRKNSMEMYHDSSMINSLFNEKTADEQSSWFYTKLRSFLYTNVDKETSRSLESVKVNGTIAPVEEVLALFSQLVDDNDAGLRGDPLAMTQAHRENTAEYAKNKILSEMIDRLKGRDISYDASDFASDSVHNVYMLELQEIYDKINREQEYISKAGKKYELIAPLKKGVRESIQKYEYEEAVGEFIDDYVQKFTNFSEAQQYISTIKFLTGLSTKMHRVGKGGKFSFKRVEMREQLLPLELLNERAFLDYMNAWAEGKSETSSVTRTRRTMPPGGLRVMGLLAKNTSKLEQEGKCKI